MPATVNVIPTLEAMAEVYRLPREGGPSSQRFRRYVDVMREDGVPAAGFNPMTGQPVLETIEALLATGAEDEAGDAASACASRLGLRDDVALFITVATPGLWTDRLSTEVEHRLAPTAWSGGTGSILMWTGEDTSGPAVRREAVAQLVRTAWIVVHGGPPQTAALAAGQEGLAYALAGDNGTRSDVVADALEVVGSDTALATKAALLYGDEPADVMGFLPLGLRAMAGYEHAIAVAHEALRTTTPEDMLRLAWTPLAA